MNRIEILGVPVDVLKVEELEKEFLSVLEKNEADCVPDNLGFDKGEQEKFRALRVSEKREHNTSDFKDDSFWRKDSEKRDSCPLQSVYNNNFTFVNA